MRPAHGETPTPRLTRPAGGRLLGGVAAGLGEHLRLPMLYVRLAFVALTAFGGFGLVLYAALWVFVPSASAEQEPAGLASAARGGRRPIRSVRPDDLGQLVALGALGLGLVLLLTQTGWGVPLTVTIPVLIAGAGMALLWSQADASERLRLGRGMAGDGEQPWLTLLRVAGGLLLVVVALVTFLLGSGRPNQIGQTVLLLVVVALGVGLLAGPFVWRLVRQLDDERHERMLQQQQADVAAHLHDSVLQTLALIQRKAHDPRAVMTLARAQERDLRGWLFESTADEQGSLRTALEGAAAEVEAAHGVPLDVVVVGDRPLDEALVALVRAAREAMVNAVVHSGAPSVDVFAECAGPQERCPGAVEVFVRDRGKGFDVDAVPPDRMGLRGSVVGRMERHGGTARVRSAPGEGTEVALMLGVNGVREHPSHKDQANHKEHVNHKEQQ